MIQKGKTNMNNVYRSTIKELFECTQYKTKGRIQETK